MNYYLVVNSSQRNGDNLIGVNLIEKQVPNTLSAYETRRVSLQEFSLSSGEINKKKKLTYCSRFYAYFHLEQL